MKVLVNFGGPRFLSEISPFLQELLTDPDVIRTKFPLFFQKWLFRRIAKKRALKVCHDYVQIGGKSPIYFDTEEIGKKLEAIPFHRYLPATHEQTLAKIESIEAEEISVLPLFPQFCYATTGSIARFFSKRLSKKTVRKLRWIKSYAAHPAFIRSYQRRISDFLLEHDLKHPALLFSAHGVPQSFVDEGDPYESECRSSFEKVMEGFPDALGKLSYQSRFGPEEWIKPYTNEVCEEAARWCEGRDIVIVPITFTSDHIETLFEIEALYLPLIRSQGLKAYRCPALNLEPYWIESLSEILKINPIHTNEMLIRKSFSR